MDNRDHWLLPEGVEEVLPPAAWQLEGARRALLDLFSRWGYELIMPPFIEYLESLLSGAGNDLDLQTFKVTDQLTGRMMGVRADMTPQAARIDAHPLQREAPNRLCYLGTVLHTRTDGFGGSRSPLQVGAELFGHAGIESDIEILSLALETIALTGVDNVHMDLGHVGIYRALAHEAGLTASEEAALFDALQRKAVTDIDALLAGSGARPEQRQRLAALAGLNGGWDVLERAREVLSGAGDDVMAALDNLAAIAEGLRKSAGDIPLNFDLAELRAYNYQTGMVFAVFVPGTGKEIARGGRYDAIGRAFGESRPATGFSTDLKTLVSLGNRDFDNRTDAIYAPAESDPALAEAVFGLRSAGESVVCGLPGQSGGAVEMGCKYILVRENGNWVVKPV